MKNKNEKDKNIKFGLFKKKKAEENAVIPKTEPEASADASEVKVKFKKTRLILPAVIILLIAVTAFTIFIRISRNDGESIALSLSEKLGTTAEKAAKNADIKLKKKSGYDFINELDKFSDVYESNHTVVINGVHVPEWVILCYSDKTGRLDEVVYYDYTVLKKNNNGLKEKKKIDTDQIKEGITIDEVEKIIDLKPIQITRDNDDKKVYKYKYYYQDKKTKDEKSYYITVMLNFDDKVMAVKEEENNFITDVITVK